MYIYIYSFVFIYLFICRRYDTSHLLDRSQTVFPDEYVSSISSRICSCARSAGAKERIESAKQSGVKSVFQSIRKPKTTSLRYKQGALRSECLSLRNVVSMLPLVSANTYTNSREVTHKDIQSIGILYSS